MLETWTRTSLVCRAATWLARGCDGFDRAAGQWLDGSRVVGRTVRGAAAVAAVMERSAMGRWLWHPPLLSPESPWVRGSRVIVVATHWRRRWGRRSYHATSPNTRSEGVPPQAVGAFVWGVVPVEVVAHYAIGWPLGVTALALRGLWLAIGIVLLGQQGAWRALWNGSWVGALIGVGRDDVRHLR